MREIRTEENLIKSLADSAAPLIKPYGFSKALTAAMKQYERMLPTDEIRRQSIRRETGNELRRRAIAVRRKGRRNKAEIKRSPKFNFRPMQKA